MKSIMNLSFALLMIFAALSVLGSEVKSNDADVSVYFGEYRLPSGDWISITKMGPVEAMTRFMYFDWQQGRFGYPKPVGPDRFCAPFSDKPDSPCQTEIAFTRNTEGKIDGLTIKEKDGEERRAIRETIYTDSPVTFSNGEVALSGTLRMPKGDGSFPAIVLVHGSGPGVRHQASILNSFFARLGMSVLVYDKRGCGMSGGDWRKVDLDVLAQDALAGLEWLRQQKSIDPKKVGLWGISQGGWITPLAAGMSENVAFAINSSGPGTSLRSQDLFMMMNILRAGGFTGEEIESAKKTFNTLYDYGIGKATAEELDVLMDKARAHPKFKDIVMPPAKEITPENLYKRQAIGDPAWFFHMNPDNDAITPYKKLRCPLLITYGKLDYTVPVEESVRLITVALKESGHKDYSIRVIESAGHGFARMQESQPMLRVEPFQFVREYFSVHEDWLRSHGFCR